MDAKKKTVLAVSLVFLWAGLAVWQWRLLQEPVRVPLTNVGGPPSAGRHLDAKSLQVNLDLLASTGLQRQETFTVPRNIFALPSTDGTLQTVNGLASVNQPSATAETLVQQNDALKQEQYRYLGFLRVGEGRRGHKDIAVIKKEDEVLVLNVGDRIEDHLVLKAINSESVTMRNTGTHEDLTVPLSEEPPEESAGQE
jgi:hypothetical protein